MEKKIFKKAVVMYIVINITVIFACMGIVFGITNSDIIITSPSSNSGFYLQGSTYTLKAYVNNNPSSVKFYCPEEELSADATLTRLVQNIYQGAWTVESSDCLGAKYVSGQGYVGWWQFEIAASNSSGTGKQFKSYAVPYKSLSFYRNVDNQFRYNTPDDSSFKVPWSDVYNCSAYVVDVYTRRFDVPDTLQEAIAFMTKTGSWSNRIGTVYTYTSSPINIKAIYYAGNGGHYAKVIGWDAAGLPTKVRSKWGGLEVIDSEGYNPFESEYGRATAYFR
ncbi:MAG: hypothetical protein BWY74_01215 [Firmicutes bacterium ADurb.Bin419]|nr:MAG: hypothetical protein BWY74_01215 [Firmicutes bacterium ADurb.Bin419]